MTQTNQTLIDALLTCPSISNKGRRHDVVIQTLNIPIDTQAVPLITADDLWGHIIRAFGFSAAFDQGRWASG